MKHSREQVVPYSVLYILFLLQIVATICAFTVESGFAVTQHLASGSFIFILMAGEFVFSAMQIVLICVWLILRLSVLIFGALGFWKQKPRRIALVILTVATAVEVLASILYLIIMSVVPLILAVAMLVLCIKGLCDLKKGDNKWCPTAYTLASPREIDASEEIPCDEQNPDP